MKKIIVAGAGHGGIVASSILSKNGFDVTVIEQKKKTCLGYDWQDVFDIRCLEEIGIKIPKNVSLSKKEEMSFYPPSLQTCIQPSILSNDAEVKMERKDLYDMLIKDAQNNGVKFIYQEKILSSIWDKNRVIGIKTDKKEYFADFVIDACGVNSPVRKSLSKVFDIEKDEGKNGKFYVYRAYYSLSNKSIPKNKYKVYLMPHESRGISWVFYDKKYVDVLIGKFTKLDEKIVKGELDFLKQHNKIGKKVLRGATFTEIPVRRPISMMIYNGYALVGDSAFMTIPLMGSGISLSIRSGKLLASVLIKQKNTDYNIESIWEYQCHFYKQFAYDLAAKDILKELLIKLDYDEVNHLFESGFISNQLLAHSTNGRLVTFSKRDILHFIKKGIRKPILLLKIFICLLKYQKIKKICQNIPIHYEEKKIKKWREKYLKVHF